MTKTRSASIRISELAKDGALPRRTGEIKGECLARTDTPDIAIADSWLLPAGATHALPAGSRFAVFSERKKTDGEITSQAYVALQDIVLTGPLAWCETGGDDSVIELISARKPVAEDDFEADNPTSMGVGIGLFSAGFILFSVFFPSPLASAIWLTICAVGIGILARHAGKKIQSDTERFVARQIDNRLVSSVTVATPGYLLVKKDAA